MGTHKQQLFTKLSIMAVSAFVLSNAFAIDEDVLPMKKILSEAKAKRAAGIDIDGATRDGVARGSFLLRSPRAKTYVMTDTGLQQIYTSRAALMAPLDGRTPEADADDGKDQTAFESINSPLDPDHLASFRLCKASRTEQGINNLNTYWMSALSAIAYLKYPLAFDRLKQMKFEQIYFIEGPSDVEVVVAKIAPKKDEKGNLIKDSGLSVVAFRGTDNAVDWLTNLDVSTQDISGHNGEAWVHEGFALALDEVYGEILKILDLSNNPSPLFITGHSLGGALGMQLAIRLVSKPDANTPALIGPKDDRLRGIYVFAIPRVGNQWARNILDKYMNRTKNVSIHIYSDADPAPKTPFDWMGYKRFGAQANIPYNSNPNIVDFGNRTYWTCHTDADFAGPSIFSSEFYYSTVDAHHMEAYVRHFAPWRARLNEMTCDDATPSWGPRFVEENPATFKPLQLPSQVGKNACEYTPFSWGGNIQL